jgi:tRNA(Arg) A34 adenosine deaminase TadA
VNSPSVALQLPDWLQQRVLETRSPFPTMEERVKFVIELSRLNIRHETGGPFAAAIFDSETGMLLAAGVNLVVTAGSSILHAEMVALLAAQLKLRTYDLSSAGMPPYELVSSTEPCAMCMGAVPWSGVRALVCGARGDDAQAAGFDEGEKPPAWVEALERRGIKVLRDILRDEAAAVLHAYRASGGLLYNPRHGS